MKEKTRQWLMRNYWSPVQRERYARVREASAVYRDGEERYRGWLDSMINTIIRGLVRRAEKRSMLTASGKCYDAAKRICEQFLKERGVR